jgi:hypothetical protein
MTQVAKRIIPDEPIFNSDPNWDFFMQSLTSFCHLKDQYAGDYLNFTCMNAVKSFRSLRFGIPSKGILLAGINF